MGLAASLRAAMAQAKVAVGDLASEVLHEPYTGQNVDAEETYGAAVPRTGVVEYATRKYRNEDRVVLSGATITFIEAVPVTLRDRFTLPDGKTAPVVAVDGVNDSGTAGLMFATVVVLGKANAQ